MIKNIPIFLLIFLHIVYVLLCYLINGESKESGFYLLFLPFHFLYLINWFYCWNNNSRILPSFRLFLFLGLFYIGSPPLYENDHYRYLWEGKVIAKGENPYTTAPNALTLNSIEYEKRNKIAYNKLTSIYPPIAQIYFTMVSPFSYKYGLIILQICSYLMLISILYELQKKAGSYLILLLPYFYKEFVQSIHIDLLAIFLFLHFIKKKYYYSAVAITFLTKLLSIIALPFFITKTYFDNKKQLYRPLFICILILFLFIIYPYRSKQISGGDAFINFWFWNSLIGSPLNALGFSQNLIRIILATSFLTATGFLVGWHIKLKAKKTKIFISTCYI